MSVQTLTVPSADEQQKLVYNRKVRASNSTELALDQKIACVLLRLAPNVTSDDYAAIGSAISAVTGVQSIELMVDGQAPSSIPENTVVTYVSEGQIRIDDVEAP